MESTIQKLKRNLREGTFLKNVPVAIKNRLIKEIKYSNLLVVLDKDSQLMKTYQKNIPMIDRNHVATGNYYLDSRVSLNHESIVYSLGILTDIAFDTAVQKAYQCAIFMYDPTPISVSFMDQFSDDPLFQFRPYGVWTEDTTLRFYEPDRGGSSSMMQGTSKKFFDAKCLTMSSIMNNNDHTHIDVWKADIEGAALPVLLQMVEQGIFPDQIIGEFERPQKDKLAINQFFEDLNKLRGILKENEFAEFQIPRKKAKYHSIELLFVNKNKMS